MAGLATQVVGLIRGRRKSHPIRESDSLFEILNLAEEIKALADRAFKAKTNAGLVSAIQLMRFRDSMQSFAVLVSLGLAEDAFATGRKSIEVMALYCHIFADNGFDSFVDGSYPKRNARDLVELVPLPIANAGSSMYGVYKLLSGAVHAGDNVQASTLSELTDVTPAHMVQLEFAVDLDAAITSLLAMYKVLFEIMRRLIEYVAEDDDTTEEERISKVYSRLLFAVFLKHPKIVDGMIEQGDNAHQWVLDNYLKLFEHERLMNKEDLPGEAIQMTYLTEFIQRGMWKFELK